MSLMLFPYRSSMSSFFNYTGEKYRISRSFLLGIIKFKNRIVYFASFFIYNEDFSFPSSFFLSRLTDQILVYFVVPKNPFQFSHRM